MVSGRVYPIMSKGVRIPADRKVTASKYESTIKNGMDLLVSFECRWYSNILAISISP